MESSKPERNPATRKLSTEEVQDAQIGLLEWELGEDALTGLKKRTVFERELNKSLRFGEACVIFIDLDNFKKVNDTLGHQEGDNVLRKVANVVTSTIRETDTAARFGGDEFYILLPQTNEAAAEVVGNKILKNLKEDSRLLELDITASIGISSSNMSTEPEKIIHLADQATGRAKQIGKNNVVVSDGRVTV